jgi:hypothetical protein
LREEQSISDLCRREGFHPSIYYKWSKAFLEAGKQRLTRDTIREADSDEVKDLLSENVELKQFIIRTSGIRGPAMMAWPPGISSHSSSGMPFLSGRGSVW